MKTGQGKDWEKKGFPSNMGSNVKQTLYLPFPVERTTEKKMQFGLLLTMMQHNRILFHQTPTYPVSWVIVKSPIYTSQNWIVRKMFKDQQLTLSPKYILQ